MRSCWRCFNPRLPGGRRHFVADQPIHIRLFQSTPSGGKATLDKAFQAFFRRVFQSTPSGGKATQRDGADERMIGRFNPRLPGGRRHSAPNAPMFVSEFQSTPSGGKATRCAALTTTSFVVSIHAFRGEGDRLGLARIQAIGVSIHAFRGEGDDRRPAQAPGCGRFNPRLPGGRRLTAERSQCR